MKKDDSEKEELFVETWKVTLDQNTCLFLILSGTRQFGDMEEQTLRGQLLRFYSPLS
jgi:hypothetical protein